MRAYISTLLFIISINSIAQTVIGFNFGVGTTDKYTSPKLTTKTNDIILWSNGTSLGFDIFGGIYLETTLLKKLRIKQELAIYNTSHSYKLLVPDNSPNSNFLYFEPVTSILFTTLNYRALVRLTKKQNFSVRAGPSIDFDFVRVAYDKPPYYAPNYLEAIELEKSLEEGYNFAIVFADVELGYNIKRLDIAVNYKYSLTSKTGKFVYDGNPHYLKTVTTQFFIRIGYQFIVKNKGSK